MTPQEIQRTMDFILRSQALNLSCFHRNRQPDSEAAGLGRTVKSMTEPTSTAITDPLQRLRMTSTGRLLSTPPSTSMCPLQTTGGQIPGIALLARTELDTRPSS